MSISRYQEGPKAAAPSRIAVTKPVFIFPSIGLNENYKTSMVIGLITQKSNFSSTWFILKKSNEPVLSTARLIFSVMADINDFLDNFSLIFFGIDNVGEDKKILATRGFLGLKQEALFGPPEESNTHVERNFVDFVSVLASILEHNVDYQLLERFTDYEGEVLQDRSTSFTDVDFIAIGLKSTRINLDRAFFGQLPTTMLFSEALSRFVVPAKIRKECEYYTAMFEPQELGSGYEAPKKEPKGIDEQITRAFVARLVYTKTATFFNEEVARKASNKILNSNIFTPGALATIHSLLNKATTDTQVLAVLYQFMLIE